MHSFQREAAGAVIQAFWKPDGQNVNRENQQVLRAWMAANGLGDEFITTFMLAQKYASDREKAVRDLELLK